MRFLVVFFLFGFGCGSEHDNQTSALQFSGAPVGQFSGCIDSSIFSPQECDYTCVDGKMSGYKLGPETCAAHGNLHGDIACYCPM